MQKGLRKRSLVCILDVRVFYAALALMVFMALTALPASAFSSPKNSSSFADLSQKPPTLKERAVLEAFAFLVNTDQLEGFLNGTVKILKYTPKVGKPLRDMPPETLELGLQLGADMIRMLVQMRGEDHSYPNVTYLHWRYVSRWMEKRLYHQEANRPTPVTQNISDPAYFQELLSLAETKESRARDFEILVNGPASFSRREKLIREAKKSIDILIWAIDDDETGFEARDQWIQKHREGVEVRVIVDGMVSQRVKFRKVVNDLIQAGISVVRWKDPNTPFFSQHRKMMIVDGTYMVAGGLNVGNSYSHKHTETKNQWRDTDIYATGDIVQQGNELFAKIWNSQVSRSVSPRQSLIRGGDISMSLIDLSPDIRRQTGSTIMLSTLKALRGAQHSIDIENAYVILFPQIETEIERALQRGVRVRVLTNSEKSVDESFLSQPILISVKRLAERGADIYLRVGSTLHSKFMIIDEKVVMVGSYNLHPGSERREGEMVFLINDSKIARDFTRVFEKDLHPKVAQRRSASQIHPKLDFKVRFTLRYFYDFL